jgi:Lysylphosphatidylglycerol synthase TM region
MFERLRRQWHTRRSGLTMSVSVGASLLLGAVLVGKWDELEAGITGAPVAVVVLAVALQVLALVSRSEAWHVCVRASGGTVSRRKLYRASSMGCVGNLLNHQLGTAARIAALRHSAPEQTPRVPALIAAELPILVTEAALAAITSFTLVGPLGLPWWTPAVCLAAVAGVSMGVRRLALAKARWLAKGLAVLRTVRGRALLLGFVLVAVFSQIARNWLMLHAVGIDASVFDAIAVLIAVVTLGQLPFGLSVGAAASVLILGPQGVTAAAATGVLLTATGTIGGLCFAAWAAVDLLVERGPVAVARRLVIRVAILLRPAIDPWTALAAFPDPRRRSIERSYFGGLSHLQITRVLGVAAA